MKDFTLYDNALLVDRIFPIIIYQNMVPAIGQAFNRHWHEQLEIILIKEGTGVIECDTKVFEVTAGDLLIINSNQIHWGAATKVPFFYYYINIDTSFIESSYNGSCEQKYITPIFENHIIFQNKVTDNVEVKECIEQLLKEYEHKNTGYELYIKSLIYKTLALLLRSNIERVLTRNEYETRTKNLERFGKVLNFIETNYNEELTTKQLADMCCLSLYHFSHLFKSLTGKTTSEYVNSIRIKKAEQLLLNTDMLISEIAISTGFSDTNYFCRLFRKYKNQSPTMFRDNHTI